MPTNRFHCAYNIFRWYCALVYLISLGIVTGTRFIIPVGAFNLCVFRIFSSLASYTSCVDILMFFKFLTCSSRYRLTTRLIRMDCYFREPELASTFSIVTTVRRRGRTWLSASFGGGIASFLPSLAQLVGLPNGRVAADGSLIYFTIFLLYLFL